MAIDSVNEVSSLINQQVTFQEKIESCLWKLEALMTVAVLTDNFYDLPEITLHNYFSVANDLIEEATKANQEALNNLNKAVNKNSVHNNEFRTY